MSFSVTSLQAPLIPTYSLVKVPVTVSNVIWVQSAKVPQTKLNQYQQHVVTSQSERLARAAIKLKRVSAALFLQLARFTNNIERAFPKRRKSFFGLILQVTTTSSWRRRKTRHSGEPPGGVVRSGFSTPRQNGSETNKKVRAALTRDCQ